MEKIYITANELLIDSFKLALQVYDSGFRPDFIIGVWRGGTPVAIAVQEFFSFKDVETDHIGIRVSSYFGIAQQSNTISVDGLDYIVKRARAGHSLLIIDDVFDTGRSLEAVINELRLKLADNMPTDVRLACPWYKPANKKASIEPSYFIHKTDQWLVFPHELMDLDREEIRQGKPELAAVLFNDSSVNDSGV